MSLMFKSKELVSDRKKKKDLCQDQFLTDAFRIGHVNVES